MSFEEYEKVKTVGQGAFGTAILYRRKDDGKQVVMKEVYTLNMDSVEKKSALNEVEILATLNHPNIIRLFGSFERDGSLIIVMEYADGGNLAQLINAKKNQNEMFTENSILNIFSQFCSAMAYMHENKILHRDLKTANIFLNLNGTLKVGDFGISKMLTTRSQANTVVGTPYYLSPEICEGNDYNEKSDIWAMGCILYELASLKKPFEAMTLPALVQKIIQCKYENIPINYSNELSKTIASMLQKEPNMRPTANFLNNEMISMVKSTDAKFRESAGSRFLRPGVPKERTILYNLTDFGEKMKITPVTLPHKKIMNFSTSSSHKIIVTSDQEIYSWGENNFGQLALNDINQEHTPSRIDFFRQETIVGCAAGRNFSVFLSEDGFLYTCGDGRTGCLGHGDWLSLNYPDLIKTIVEENITKVCCGDDHVLALSSEGKIFTWGCSKCGQLGQGHTQNRCKPLAIKLPKSSKISEIFAGEDSSAIITSSGQVFVCGNNTSGKLGISDQQHVTLFSSIETKDMISSISIGRNQTAMLTQQGTVIVVGTINGKIKKISSPQIIKLKNKITAVTCGFNFTVAADSKHVLWFWGSPYRTYRNVKEDKVRTEKNSVVPFAIFPQENSLKDSRKLEFEEKDVKQPLPILAFYANKTEVKAGNAIIVKEIVARGEELFVLADTKAPPPIQEYTIHDALQNSFYLKHNEGTTHAPLVYTALPNTPSH